MLFGFITRELRDEFVGVVMSLVVISLIVRVIVGFWLSKRAFCRLMKLSWLVFDDDCVAFVVVVVVVV